MNIKKLASIITACALLALLPATALAQGEANTPKEEVVYASLNGDGSFNKAYVVNSFYLQSAGQIIDYGNYDSVLNLTTTDQLNRQGDEVSINAPAGRFFYQGDISHANLPWNISITYLLNGKPVEAQDLAGANGSLQIDLKISDSGNADQTFTKNYMLQTSMTFDTGICSNITADKATIANSGKNKIVNFIKLPGKDAEYSVQMDVAKFEMPGIQISGLPLSLGISTPDTSSLTSGINKLQDGISSLDSGGDDLSGGAKQLSDGTQSMTDGLKTFQGGLWSLESGFSKLTSGNSGIHSGSDQILNALNAIKTQLDGFSVDTINLAQLTQGSTAILQGIGQTSDGLAGLENSFTQADQGISSQSGGAYSSLHQANADTISQLNLQIAALTAADPSGNAAQIAQLTQIVGLLTADDQLILGLKTGINGDGTASNPGLAAGAASLKDQYAQFDTGIQALPSQLNDMASGLTQLKSGIDQLAGNYSSFNDGIVQYTGGVQSLYNGYYQLCTGFSQIVQGSEDLSGGADSLSNGAQQLSNGTDELYDQTKNMDSDMQKQIDDMMKAYTGGDFTQVSFVSSKNTNIKSVQFVIMTSEIKIEKVTEAQQQPASQTDFWQKLLDLFGLKSN